MGKVLAILFILILGICYLCNAQRIQAENYFAQKGVQTENCSEGGLNVSSISSNDWMEYSVPAGTYRIAFRVAAPNSGSQFQLRNSNDVVLWTIPIPKTGAWQSWTTITTGPVTIPSRIKIFSNTLGWNFNWFELIPINTPPVVNAGKDTIVYFPMNDFRLYGQVSDPGDSVKVEWSWAPDTSIINCQSFGEIYNKDSLNSVAWFAPGFVTLRLTATDSKGVVSFHNMKITILYDPYREVSRVPLGITGTMVIFANGSYYHIK